MLQWLPFLAFITVIAWVARTTAVVVLARRRPTRLEAPAIALAVLGVPCIAWGFVEPRTLTETRASLGPGGLVIAHVSDLHVEAWPGLEVSLPARVAAARPDLVCFTGDALNDPAGLERFRACMTALARVAPTFAVRGNWDVNYWDALPLFRGTGARELNGDVAVVAVRGRRVAIAGLAYAGEAADQAVAAIRWPRAAARVLLHHTPDPADAAAAAGCELMLAGHTHGGQVALPGFGALITLARDGKRFEAGAYRVGPMAMYVSRGIGMEGGHAPRVRFLAPPELAILTF